MIDVEPSSPADRKPKFCGCCDQGPIDRGQPRVTLADVVEERGPHQVGAGSNPASRLVAVPLIDGWLRKERGPFKVQIFANPAPFFSGQAGGVENPQEPPRQMAPGAEGQDARRDLQSMQSVASGRASSRAALISRPQFSHMPYFPFAIRARAASTSSS